MQNDSEIKNSSSMNQDKSFMSSSKSEAESEPETKKEKLAQAKKESK
jgi:hypothetical protein